MLIWGFTHPVHRDTFALVSQSHIAAALAKSQGRKVTPPLPGTLHNVPSFQKAGTPNPFLTKLRTATGTPKPAPSQYSPVPPPKITRWFIVTAGLVFLAMILGAAAWYYRRSSAPAISTPTTQASAAISLPAASLAADPVRSKPSPILADRVRTLPITGAAAGGSQRLSVRGIIFEPGDTVTEGLILQSIENSEIVFRDAEGNLYKRRF